MSKGRKVFLVAVVVSLFLYTVVGFLGVPWIITTQLPPKLSEKLGRPIAIQDAGFIPFLLKLQVKGFDIQELGLFTFAGI